MIYSTGAGAAPGKGELKNEGLSHYVIENKYKKMSVWEDPIISMKIKGLFYSSHYIYENKGSCAPG